MINLKLAQYNEKGEFEKFLELGKDFLLGGEFIVFHNPNNQHNYKHIDINGLTHIDYKKDQKDPFNRFDGLFDGRTYGEGRFVLICGFDDYHYPDTPSLRHWQDSFYEEKKLLRLAKTISDEGFFQTFYFEQFSPEEKARLYGYFSFSSGYATGNLHENPKLFNRLGYELDSK